MNQHAIDIARALNERVSEHPVPGWFVMEQKTEDGVLETRIGIASEVHPFQEGDEGAWSDLLETGADDEHWVVILAYEFGRGAKRAAGERHAAPIALAMRVPVYISVVHDTGISRVIASTGAPKALIQLHRELLEQHGESASISEPRATGQAVPQRVRWKHDEVSYAKLVAQAQDRLRRDGGSVLCLTNRATLITADLDPLETYVQLQRTHRAPHAGLIVTGQHALISASPETFVRIRGARVTTRPMKGTRPRGGTPWEDDALARELRSDPKELRENRAVTEEIVSLMRTCCERESVRVVSDCVVQQFELVHQLVSVVEGTLAEDQTATPVSHAVRALFPSASMTGVPSEQAQQTLNGLEAERRGWYSGCFGWVAGPGRECDLAVTIRSIEVHADEATIGSGGGVTLDSVPESEVAEMLLKARALLSAVTVKSRD